MGHGDYNTSVNLTGNHAPTIRPMTEVQGCRLSKGQTFSHRDIIILRVKEEANLRDCQCKQRYLITDRLCAGVGRQ